MSTYVMWFRKDLRLEDNTAFYHALEDLNHGDKLLCVFHINEKQVKADTHAHDYFFQTLQVFIKESEDRGIKIHLMSSDLVSSFEWLKTHYTDFTRIYFNLDNRGFGQKRDKFMIDYFKSIGIDTHYFEDSHLHRPNEIFKKDGEPYKVYTPYYKQWIQLPKPKYRELSLETYKDYFIDDTVSFKVGNEAFKNITKTFKVDFSDELGSKVAMDRLNTFVFNDLEYYQERRDYPSKQGTSRLSAYLSTGVLSIRQIYHACQQMPSSNGKETYIKELAWREFYHMIYFYYPNQYQQEFLEKFRALPWSRDMELFEVWKEGRTGFPIVDAAMRQLKETGWMHNRLRMIVASFLTKDLRIDWRLGERYFAEMLIDYDAANNIGGWQWSASVGTDASPYFRIFNPTTQGIRFDEDALFIKQYVRELKNLPAHFCHEPLKMSEQDQKKYGIILGKDYPLPIVDHNEARKSTLEWYQNNEIKFE